MPNLQRVYEEYKDKVDFLALNGMESKETVDDFLINENGAYTFPIGYDEDGSICDTLLIEGFPTNLLIDKNGVLVANLLGSQSEDEIKRALSKLLK